MIEEAELRLISSLKRNLSRHKAEEQKTGFDYPAWQAEKLRNIEKFRRENLSIMNEYTDVIDEQTRQLMREQFEEGERSAEQSVGQDSSDNISGKHFFEVNNEKMNTLMTDITTLEKHAETAALRMTDDVYRQTVHKVQIEMAVGGMTLNKALDLAVRDFLDKGINCIVYSDGKRVNIADYVRMALRTTSARAKLQGEAKRFAELGYDTVMTSQYGRCSKTCEPWQGRVYIDDVFTLWDGEVEERANGELWGRSKYCGKWFCLLSTAIHKGLFHPNCRHTILQYIDGVTKLPEPIPAEKIKEQRELEQKQRRMERNIRKLRRLKEGTFDPDTAKEYGRKLRAAQHELKVFTDEHNDILSRDYSREQYYRGAVDKSEKSGIIKIEEVKSMTINSIERPIEMPIEQKHTGKGNPNAVLTFGVELNNRQKRLLEQLSDFDSKLIVNRSEVNMADLSALTAQTGHEFAMFTRGEERLIVRGNEYMVQIDIDTAEQLAKSGYRWSGHTHPGTDFLCMQPSDGDYAVLNCFSQNNSVIYNSKGDFRTFEKRSE